VFSTPTPITSLKTDQVGSAINNTLSQRSLYLPITKMINYTFVLQITEYQRDLNYAFSGHDVYQVYYDIKTTYLNPNKTLKIIQEYNIVGPTHDYYATTKASNNFPIGINPNIEYENYFELVTYHLRIKFDKAIQQQINKIEHILSIPTEKLALYITDTNDIDKLVAWRYQIPQPPAIEDMRLTPALWHTIHQQFDNIYNHGS
jgi:hypothetical protein